MDEVDQILHIAWDLIKIIITSLVQAAKISIESMGKAIPQMMDLHKKK